MDDTATQTDLPEVMTAIAITEPGEPSVLKPEQRPLPELRPGEVLIRVRAAGVNRPDVAQRQGTYPAPKDASDLPGLEVSGEIAALGPDTPRWRVGDAVVALTPGGGYAEYCRVHGSNVLPLPEGFTFIEGAAVPETFFTVWHNVFERGGLQPGETFLVHGGTSGIGTTAIQLAKAFGARVITTAGSAEKCAACEKLGAERAINYRDEDFVEAVKEFTGGNGVDLILDMVGGDYVGRNYDAAAVDGRIVQIAVLQGAKVEINVAKLMMKRLTHTGSTLRPRTVEFKAAVAGALEAHVWPLLGSRQVAPVMDQVFPLREAWRAHERMEEGNHIGKIILDVA
ncbi:NAD(P)H-quinone oxidoreductase [Tianweitania populi]|uniref:NAD(P)H quinone oxidoreductase n=1 Tax=Tianweitania populi TaxID=1607949 RepID=A0A8J3GJZ6_9HYPH|nr:NAD(P)H-quinone oxidoreductase [Tianweitania populi]GHD04933.1 NAD(P)H quinone oxidoreductase [Tianweitania populi]